MKLKNKKQSVYKKPIFIKETKLSFPKEIYEKFGGSCKQCSMCHGCR